MTPDDHRIAARHGALRALRAGTTTLADSGPTGAGAAAMAEVGLRGAVHLEAFGTPEGDEARAAPRRRWPSASRRSTPRPGPGVRVGLSPHAPYTVGPALWRALDAEPALAGRPWATHLAESEDEDARRRPTARARWRRPSPRAGFAPGRWDGRRRRVDRRAGSRAAGALRAGLVAAHCVRLGRRRPGDPARARA